MTQRNRCPLEEFSGSRHAKNFAGKIPARGRRSVARAARLQPLIIGLIGLVANRIVNFQRSPSHREHWADTYRYAG